MNKPPFSTKFPAYLGLPAAAGILPGRKAESFDDLGAHFELTTAGGAEKAYRKAVNHLTKLLVEDNAIGTVTVKRKKVIRRKKKIAAAVYEYQADYDGE